MAIADIDVVHRESTYRDAVTENEYERWHAWPVNWSGVWVAHWRRSPSC